MLKLFVYGYLNCIQSSRRLEREAGRNVELMWLLGCLAPDFKTIADFKRDNGKCIKHTCRELIGLCRQMHMFTDVIVAIDGRTIRGGAAAGPGLPERRAGNHIFGPSIMTDTVSGARTTGMACVTSPMAESRIMQIVLGGASNFIIQIEMFSF